MESQLKELSISYEIIEGRNGADIDVIDACSDSLSLSEHGKFLTFGEKGCAFSHRLIYEKMLKECIPYAVILEDDVVLPKNFKEIVIKSINHNNICWDWLSFDYPKIGHPFIKAWLLASKKMVIKNKLFIFYAILKFPAIVALSTFEISRDYLAKYIPSSAGPKLFYRPLYNAGAYIISTQGIKKLEPLLYPIRFSADRTPNQARVKVGLKMRWYVPRIVHQTDEDAGNTFFSNTLN